MIVSNCHLTVRLDEAYTNISNNQNISVFYRFHFDIIFNITLLITCTINNNQSLGSYAPSVRVVPDPVNLSISRMILSRCPFLSIPKSSKSLLRII